MSSLENITVQTEKKEEQQPGLQNSGPKAHSFAGESPPGFDAQESPRVLSVISTLLERTIARNEKYEAQHCLEQCSIDRGASQPNYRRLTVFHGLKAPAISVEKYVERIFKYANCSPSCFVVAYAYLDRFLHQQPGIPITSLNVHRLVITSVMVAAKFLDDAYYSNAYYAKVGGVNAQEMNRLELEFLFRLGFRLHVTVQAFDSYCTHLEREVEHVQQQLPVMAITRTINLQGIAMIHNNSPIINVTNNCGLLVGTSCIHPHHHHHHHHQDVS